LSELEGVVLGILQGKQPCTAYGIRMALQDSPSSFWSASAGAIYPLLNRLEKAGLVDASVDAGDARGRRLLTLTAAGRARHRQWMLSAGSVEVASAVSDPVRSRAFFLGAMDAADRRTFVDDSLQALESFLESARQDLVIRTDSEDSWAYLAALGGVHQAEARVKWMREIRDHLYDDSVPPVDR